jgi:hypothetical protein
VIYIYKRGTGMGRLARELRLSVQFPYENRQLKRRHNLNLNWGCVKAEGLPEDTLNRDIRSAAQKRDTFRILGEKGIWVPRWNVSFGEFRKAYPKVNKILARRDGLSKGIGIKEIGTDGMYFGSSGEPDFYVERLTCQREFRAHVWRDEVILLQAKVVPPGCTNFIHNFENGCHYTTQNLDRWVDETLKSDITATSVSSVKALGLDFGAVDLILTKKGRLYVLEINTAPGLRSDAAQAAYKRALKNELERRS